MAEVIAVIDRFEEEWAVLVLEPAGQVVNWPASLLPEGAKQGDVIRVEMHLDPQEMQQRKKAVEERIARLRQRGEKKS